MSTGGSSRATRLRGRNRPGRAVALAIVLGMLLIFMGWQDGGRQAPNPGARGVPAAGAATESRSGRAAGQERGAAEQPLPATPAIPDPSGAVVAALAPALPDLLFDPTSLASSAPGAERVDLSEMALRSRTLPPPGSDRPPGEPAQPAAAPAPTPRLAGTWVGDRAACRRRNSAYLPLVIDEKGARAGSSSCRFDRTRQTGNRWTIAATCRNGQETWAANVKLILEGTRLTWTSERGTERYQRCP